jgi:hypothetical protein
MNHYSQNLGTCDTQSLSLNMEHLDLDQMYWEGYELNYVLKVMGCRMVRLLWMTAWKNVKGSCRGQYVHTFITSFRRNQNCEEPQTEEQVSEAKFRMRDLSSKH